MQNIELRLPINNNWTIWIFYTILQQVTDQSDQQCKFLGVHITHRFMWDRGTLTVVVGGVVPKLGDCVTVLGS